ncbi:MtrAB system accessory lipoprotein LpqB [Nocardioides marinquilinus]|uniref:MtrAB system accessory lipoprotein LpqB n=1 Tax=Nocardioides marinquilinus TaxID=1210400 RepID=A0ABP9PQ74_9ACTN
MRRRVAAAAAAVGVLLGGALAGCTGMPDAGPVVDSDAGGSVDDDQAFAINAVPPAPGAEAVDVVDGFLDAMTASPPRVDVVRQYLTTAAAAAWDPDAATITYTDFSLLTESPQSVTVDLVQGERLGSAGEWRGRLSPEQQRLDLDVVIENGEYRVANPPDALVVPQRWFEQRYRAASLYFFDPGGRILVPQPVFVPRGERLVSTLVSRLVAGPGTELDGVARSFVPTGLDAALSVPVTSDGVAVVELTGEPGRLGQDAGEKMLAQVGWTLAQDPSVRVLRLTVDGDPVLGPDGDDEYDVDRAAGLDPSVPAASTQLYGLRDGVLSRLDDTELLPVDGVLGDGDLPLRSVGVRLDAGEAAAVSADGRTLYRAPLRDVGGDPAAARPVAFRGTDLLTPVWDHAGRVWVVDRTKSGAVVRYLDGDRVRRVEVPGISGRLVSSFLVSRDATRFVAAVRDVGDPRDLGDEVRVGRIAVDDSGRPAAVASTRPIVLQSELQRRVKDIVWTSPTTIAMLVPTEPGEVFDVRSIGVDGSPVTDDAVSTFITEPVLSLAGAPSPELPTYAVTRTSLRDLTQGGTYGFIGPPPTTLGYVG